jgi:hypothetical protein
LNLTRSRRIQIFKDILRYATNRERSLLFQVINRNIPGITKADVVRAFGEQFFSRRAIPPTPAALVAPVKPPARFRKKEVEMFRPLKSLGCQ